MKNWLLGCAVVAALGSAGSASAELLTYNVNMNFDPTTQEGGPGVGTITGTFTIDTSIPIAGTPGATTTQPTDVVAVDLVESTNDGLPYIGGAFGSPTYTSFAFNEYQPVTHIFFGSPIVFQTVPIRFSPTPTRC